MVSKRTVDIDVASCKERSALLRQSYKERYEEECKKHLLRESPYSQWLTEYEARMLLDGLRKGRSLTSLFKAKHKYMWAHGRWSEFSLCSWMEQTCEPEWNNYKISIQEPHNLLYEAEDIQFSRLQLIYNLRKVCEEWIETFREEWIEDEEHPWPWSDNKPGPYARSDQSMKPVQLARLPEGWTSDTNYEELDFHLSSKQTVKLLGITNNKLTEWRRWRRADDKGLTHYQNSLPFFEKKQAAEAALSTGHHALDSVAFDYNNGCSYSLNAIDKWLEDPHPQLKPSDYLYLMSNESMPNLVKIGRSKDVEKRRRAMSRQSHVPTPFEVVWALPYIKSFDLEKAVHVQFENNRPNGSREFFTIDDEVTTDLILETAKQLALKEGVLT